VLRQHRLNGRYGLQTVAQESAMTLLIKTAIAVAMIMPAILPAQSDEIPTLDVRPVCRGIASQSADPLDVGLQTTFEQCVQSEQTVHDQLKKEWSTFSAADKQHCVTLAKTGGESSNTELLTCLEMARDVRAFRSAAATSQTAATAGNQSIKSGKAKTRAPSSPSPSATTVQLPRAESASPPPSANEPAKVGDMSSILKELSQAKADAQTARNSEAMAKRELAEAQTDLKRAKEEASQSTKEVQQAKEDAQGARKSQAATENKLAAAEAARVAAEGREQACQGAAKSQPGLGARLRSWFGHKPSNP
jgi:hypothetical protein